MQKNNFGIGGTFDIACYDGQGILKWRTTAKNGVVNQGLNNILDNYFNGTDDVGGESGGAWGWAVGIIDNAGFTALAAADTHATHTGWTEFTDYDISSDSGIRPEWDPDPAASQQVTNSTLVNYDITSAGTIYGVFCVGGTITGSSPAAATAADNKGSTNATPILWATAQFSTGPQAVVNGDIIRVTYNITGQSA